MVGCDIPGDGQVKAQKYAKAWVHDSGGMEDLKFKRVGGARSPMGRNAIPMGGEKESSLFYPGTSGR